VRLAAALADEILPPIQVYRVGGMYFVKDGNHRVSVAKEKGMEMVDADVIESFKAEGQGWQSRINDVLHRDYLARPDEQGRPVRRGGGDEFLAPFAHFLAQRCLLREMAADGVLPAPAGATTAPFRRKKS